MTGHWEFLTGRGKGKKCVNPSLPLVCGTAATGYEMNEVFDPMHISRFDFEATVQASKSACATDPTAGFDRQAGFSGDVMGVHLRCKSTENLGASGFAWCRPVMLGRQSRC